MLDEQARWQTEETALVPYAARPPSRWQRVLGHATFAGGRLRSWCGLGPAMVISIAVFYAGAPVISIGLAGVGAIHYVLSIGLQTRHALVEEEAGRPFALPLEPDVEPQEIAAADLRVTYQSILRVHEEIRRALLDAERIQACVRGVFDRCGSTARAAGRLARLANPLHQYLDSHDPIRIRDELQRLRNSAERTDDVHAMRTYGNAAAARARQLETFGKMQRLRDRVRARLELVAASLESVSALVVELRVRDLAEIELAREPLADQLQTLHDELEVLETTMEEHAWSPDHA